MNQKGALSIFVIGVILVIAVTMIGYFTLKQKETQKTNLQSNSPTTKEVQTEQQMPLTSEDDTADWKTYRSEEFGYELKYPADWYITEPVVNPLEILSFKADQEETRRLGIPQKEISVGVYVNKNIPYRTAVEWADQKKIFSKKEESMVGGEKALRGRMNIIGLNNIVGIDKGFAGTILIHNNIGYEVIYYPYNSARVNTYNKILSTFKFFR